MKKRHIIMALCLPLVIGMASCQKDNPTDNGAADGSGINGGGSGKQLTKLTTVKYRKYYFNYNLQYTSGSCDYTSFQYSNGYWTGMGYGEFESDGEVYEEGGDYVVNYDNNGHITGYTSGGQTHPLDITYDSDGHVTRVYTTWTNEDGSGWSLSNYTWENGVMTRYTSQSSGSDETRVTTYEWENGNLVREERVRSSYRETTTYLYDNHPSYMSGMREDVRLMIAEDPEYLSKNNVIKKTETTVYNSDGSTYTYSYNYVYTYGSDGYPISFKRTDNDNNSGGSYTNVDRTTYVQYGDGSGATAPTMYYIGTGNTNGFDRYYVNGSGWYAQDAMVMLYASEYYGYRFDHWQDGNTSNPRSFTCTGNATYTATYVPN